MFCPKCGQANLESALKCVQCGAEISTTPYGPARPAAPGPCPPNNLVLAILTTLFCCLPAGIVSIIYAAQVNSKYTVGDYAGAVDSSNKARTWGYVSLGVGLVGIILYIVVVAMIGVAHRGYR